MLGKTFKGMTDALLDGRRASCWRARSRRDGYTVCVRPELVVEIAFNDLQESPQYPGGLALRFARVKGYRERQAAGGGRHDRDGAGAARGARSRGGAA